MNARHLIQRGFGDFLAHARGNFLIAGVLSIAVASFSFSISMENSVRQYIALTFFRTGNYLTIYNKKNPLQAKELKALEEAFARRGTVNAVSTAVGKVRTGSVTTGCILRASFYPEPDPSDLLVSGRWISEDDEQEGRFVGIANIPLLKALAMDSRSATGRTIEVNGHPVVLIGVKDQTASDKLAFGELKYKVLTIPSSVLRSRILRTDAFNTAWICLAKDQRPSASVDEATQVLRKCHGLMPGAPNDFTVLSSEDMRKETMESTLPVRAGSWIVAFISTLLAVGVGWHIFALQAQQRMREWGIQRALGATRGNVLAAYLAESGLLLSISILLGLFFGAVATWIVRAGANHDTSYSLDPNLFVRTTISNIAITIVAWFIAGGVVALFPFRKAMKKTLPEMLRQS
jgi:putative ABC transport system permease protein